MGVEILRQKIETIRLHQYNNDVDLMITDIEKSFKRIKSLGGTCDSIIRYTITALRSGPNDEFNAYINRIKDNVESRSGQNKDISFDTLCEIARGKFNNMHANKEWDKVNPCDAQILALTTEVQSLKKTATVLASAASNNSQGQDTNQRSTVYGDGSDKVGNVDR